MKDKMLNDILKNLHTKYIAVPTKQNFWRNTLPVSQLLFCYQEAVIEKPVCVENMKI